MSFNWRYTFSTPSVEGVGKVSRNATAVAMFWLALVKAVDSGGDIPSPRLSVGEVGHYDLLYLERRLAVVQFGQLGFNGRLLARKVTLSLHGPALGVSVLNAGLRLLLLLIGM
jgi:hypothetical protein